MFHHTYLYRKIDKKVKSVTLCFPQGSGLLFPIKKERIILADFVFFNITAS